jgi:hypothetical protein
MDQALSSRATRALACAGALLSAAGCLTGVNVGRDGTGGYPSATSGTAGAGGGVGPVATGATCTSPSALLCRWGKLGGPCGGSRPNKKDCETGTVCLGDTADTEGTCVFPGDVLSSPGDNCVNPSGTACPFDHACDSTFFPGGVGGTCSVTPTNCSLDDPGAGPVSAASITIEGDGPTRHYDFACNWIWGTQLTGEANVHVGHLEQPPSIEWLFINGCASPYGDVDLGSIDLAVPLVESGTVTMGEISYTVPYVNGVDPSGNFVGALGGSGLTFTVTEVTADVVRGTFDVIVENAASEPPKHLVGAFDVCRVPDHVTP